MPKKNTPHLSIVIPTYNEAGNIEKVVESSYKEAKKLTNDFEIIVCDDGSTDTTPEIVKKYQMDFPFGASNKVIAAAERFVKKFGRNELKYVAKTHFKTAKNL